MKVEATSLADVLLITVDRFEDDRGFFMESYSEQAIQKEIGFYEFVQDNHSKSSKGVLRGLHYQIEHPQGKLIRCTQGAVYDAFVDIRQHSETFGKSLGIVLDRPEQLLWIPPGFAHGFLALEKENIVHYYNTNYRSPKHETGVIWNDKTLKIKWPTKKPILSKKDKKNLKFDELSKKLR